MELAIFLILLAVILGGTGLLVEGLKWLLIIAILLVIASFIANVRRY